MYKKNPDRWAEYYTTALSNLSGFYYDQNRVKEAIVLEEESLQIRKPLYKKNPDRWAELYTKALNNLACSYFQQGDKVNAFVFSKKAYEESAKILGEDHHHTQEMKENYLYVKEELKK